MSGDGIEIAPDFRHVHRHVHRRLRSVHQHRHTLVTRAPADRRHIHDSAEHVRHMRDRNQPGARRDGRQHRLGVQIAVRVNVDPFDHHALPFAQEMPRNDVGVMFQDAQDDLIPGLKSRCGPGIGYQIDRLGRAGGEHDVIGTGPQKARNLGPRRFVVFGRKVRQIVQATVNIGIFMGIGPRHRVDHHLRLLGRGAIVQIDQRLAPDLDRQDREIGANFFNVIHAEPPTQKAAETPKAWRSPHR